MRDVRRADSAEPLVELLTTPRRGEDGEATFATIMDLLIFAAGVGFKSKRREAVPSSGKGIPFAIFERNQKDGYIYIMALAETQTAGSLASEVVEGAIQTFEEYAAGGLEIIQAWLNENPTDVSGVQTLLSQLTRELEISSVTTIERPSPV